MTIIWEFSLRILDKSLTGKNPPDEIIENAKFKESKVRKEKILRITNIKSVMDEYNKKIFIACLKISVLSKEIKLVKDFLKLSS